MNFSNKRKEIELNDSEQITDIKKRYSNCKKLATSICYRSPLSEISTNITNSITQKSVVNDCRITISRGNNIVNKKNFPFKNLKCCLNLDDQTWNEMCLKDLKAMEQLNPLYLSYHPGLLPQFRTVLFDWLMEVSELYTMNRDTYYITIDYIDRYLSVTCNYPRAKLQLLGIASLMVASKIEEMNPPPLEDLTYISDDACSAKEIIVMERDLLETVGWSHTLWTANKWLNLYIHMIGVQVSSREFTLMTHLLDISTLDIQCLGFSNRVLAATCLSLVSQQLPIDISFLLPNLSSCLKWMAAYWNVIQKTNETHQAPGSPIVSHCRIFCNATLNHKYIPYIPLYEKGQHLIEKESILPHFL